jgi:hypothetical protein
VEDFSAGHATWVVDGHSFYPDSETVAQLEPISSAIYRLTIKAMQSSI